MDSKSLRTFLMCAICTVCFSGCEGSPYQPTAKVHEEPVSIAVAVLAHEASVPAGERKAHPAFHKMMDVLTDKYCVNCHPNDGIPKQGEDSHPHLFGMERGAKNHGFEATQCSTCHQDANNEFSGVPGAPEWSLAPDSMKWFGLTRVEIAQSMLTAKNNGGRDNESLVQHLTEHALVMWAWDPGVDAAGKRREPISVPKDEYIAAVKTWFDGGAIIPGETEAQAAVRTTKNAVILADNVKMKKKKLKKEEY